MSPEILKEIQNQLNSLPKKVREIISSIDITNEIASLRVKHHLMLDQIATLELETMLVMIGLDEAENFADNIKTNLNIEKDKAEALAHDINELIFNKIRHAMMEEDKEGGEEEDLDKDSILKEIENPTPTFPQTQVEQTKTQENSLPEIAPTLDIQKYTSPNPATKSIMEQKLSQPTYIKTKETEMSLKKIPQILNNSISTTQKPVTDPYKEPIV